MTSPKKLLVEFEGFAKKKFGQHFLCSPGIIENIVNAADISDDEQIVEIGPGLGALTDHLIGLGKSYRAYEIDSDMVAFLKHRHPCINIFQGNAANMDWTQSLRPSWVCVSNLPYNVGTTIVTNMLLAEGVFSRLIVMLQKEVALRMLAPNGDRKRGSLSVFCQLYSEVQRILNVPPGAFYPPPKVDSTVISLVPRRHPAFLQTPVNDKFLQKLIKLGFVQPRKTLHNNLKKHFDHESLNEAYETASIDPKRRPATLNIFEWVHLGHILEKNSVIG